MQKTMISTLKHNSRGIFSYEPNTDSEARIAFTEDDGEYQKTYLVDDVANLAWPYELEMGVRMPVTLFSLQNLPKSSWEVSLTSSRIYVWTSFSTGMFGKSTQQKRGKSSGGRLKYSTIGRMTTGGKEDGTFRTLNLDFVFGDDKDYHSRLNIVANAKAIGELASALYSHVSEYLKSSGDNPPQEELDKWNQFVDTDWSTGKQDVFLPTMK
jgi:hypothetical protein